MRDDSPSQYHDASRFKSDIFLTVEGAICDDSGHVRVAREQMVCSDW